MVKRLLAAAAILVLSALPSAFAQLPIVTHAPTPTEIASPKQLDQVDLNLYATCPPGSNDPAIMDHFWRRSLVKNHPQNPNGLTELYTLDVVVRCLHFFSLPRLHVDRWPSLFFRKVPLVGKCP